MPRVMNVLAVLAALALLSGCAVLDKEHVSTSPHPATTQATPHVSGSFPTVPARSYVVFGQSYRTLATAAGYDQTGIASWYGDKFHGRPTASGHTYDMYQVSAAHKTLPLGTVVKVTNLENGRSLDMVVNDRGPFVGDRLIDLSYGAARKLGTTAKGLAQVRVQAVGHMDLDGYTPPTATVASRPVSKPAASASTSATTSAKSGQGYYIQVGAFSVEANARNVLADLKARGYTDSHIEIQMRGNTRLHVVKAGAFPAQDSARQAQAKLNAAYPGCFIRS